MTLSEMKRCELFAEIVMRYRDKGNFIMSPCWMDEWALGYFCALRDGGLLTNEQWQFLCAAFQPEDLQSELS